jgi:stress-induced morphogen
LIAPDQIREKILSAMPGAQVTVRDVTGTADHYEVEVISEAFREKTLIERHRMVYAPLQDVLGGALHALSLKTIAPGE